MDMCELLRLSKNVSFHLCCGYLFHAIIYSSGTLWLKQYCNKGLCSSQFLLMAIVLLHAYHPSLSSLQLELQPSWTTSRSSLMELSEGTALLQGRSFILSTIVFGCCFNQLLATRTMRTVGTPTLPPLHFTPTSNDIISSLISLGGKNWRSVW